MKIDKGLMGGSSTLLVLSLLAEKDCYGYEMIRTLEERSDKTFLYSEGTLYPILHKLESKGWVRSYKERTEVGRERKYYALTGSARRSLHRNGNSGRRFRRRCSMCSRAYRRMALRRGNIGGK